MTIATDLGFKIGGLYRVVEDVESSYYKKGMVVKFTTDDGSTCPWFEYISGPTGKSPGDGHTVCIDLDHLVSVEQPKISANKPLLLLYIQQQYPDDKVLKALVESI